MRSYIAILVGVFSYSLFFSPQWLTDATFPWVTSVSVALADDDKDDKDDDDDDDDKDDKDDDDAFVPLATGQTVAFQASKNDGFIGFVAVDDDGTLQLGPPLSYTVSGDGLTITDNNTGLMWEIKEAGGGCLHCVSDTYKWSGSGTEETIWDWLDDVNEEGVTGFAGYDDWRIPNLRELLSIVDYGQDGQRRLIDPAFDPAGDEYWTSTSPLPRGDDPAMGVNFQQGSVIRSDRGVAFFIRAVRGP